MMRSQRTKSLLKSDGPGGYVVRHLLPTAIALLMVFGFLRWRGQEQGLYGTTVGVLLLTAAAIGLLVGLLWYLARWLDRNEEARQDVAGQLSHTSRYFELSRDLACTAGFDGFFKELNAAWTEALGWSEAELRSRPFVEFVHPDDKEITELETAGLSQGGVTVDFVNRYATKDGGWRWFDWKAIAIEEEGLIYASARDVTHRKAAEASLQAGERQTRQIIETAYDAFISMDSHGLITGWNPQAETVFGWSCDEVLGNDLSATIIPEEHREAHKRGIKHFLATGEGPVLGKRLELSALHRDGHEFPTELTISAVRTEDGYGFNAFLRDITERRRAQDALALAHDQALEASRMKSMFVANVSHEIRTPMNGVIGMAGLLLGTELDEAQREYAETISSSGDALLKVIDDILEFSKIEAGKLELDPLDFDLHTAIEKACEMLAPRAHEKGLELVVEVGADVPTRVHGDSARLRQVILNLVSNAIKFTAAGEVLVRASSSPDGQGAALVRLEVSDTGIGIEREVLQRLFTPFSQADGSTTRKYGGTGLGLAISRRLVELMGGKVDARSELGKGSSFWFEISLPCVQGSDGEFVHRPVSERVQRPASVESGAPRRGVLVVEDTSVNQVVAMRMLEQCGFHAQVARNGREALEALEAEDYEVVLMDCQMPEMDGYEATAEIRRRERSGDRHTAIIAITANTMQGDRERCLAAGMDDYLSKPLRPQALKDALARWAAQPSATINEAPPILEEAVIAELESLDGEVLPGLLSLYFEEASSQLPELRAALERGEAPTIAAAAHKLKGSSRTVGAGHLSQIAAKLEATARAGDLAPAGGLLDGLHGALEETREAFRDRPATPSTLGPCRTP